MIGHPVCPRSRKLTRFAILSLILSACLTFTASADTDEEREVSLKLPPASLGQWYKPANERQVWLHTMFKLRREMLAVSDYLALEDSERLGKWAGRLAEHYRSIGDMVPEWRDELELEQLDRLQKAVQQNDYQQVAAAQRKLGHSCTSCHREYRAMAAAIYRSPDFSTVAVEDSDSLEEVPFKKVMERLSLSLNRTKIASEDGRTQAALDNMERLRQRLDDLGQSCESCHEDPAPRDRILGEALDRNLASLEQSIEAGDTKQAGRHLGTLAVQTCARCHGVHRVLSDLKQEIAPSDSPPASD